MISLKHSVLAIALVISSCYALKDSDYSECSRTQGCIGYNYALNPDNANASACVSAKNCSALLRFSRNDEGFVNFELKGKPSQSPGYIAMALSDDNNMGDDSVVQCVLSRSQVVKVYQSYNKKMDASPKLLNQDEGIRSKSGTYINGELSCVFQRPSPYNITVPYNNNTASFDLYAKQWYIFLASGGLINGTEDDIVMHDYRVASKMTVNLTEYLMPNSASVTFVQLSVLFLSIVLPRFISSTM